MLNWHALDGWKMSYWLGLQNGILQGSVLALVQFRKNVNSIHNS